MSLEQFRLDNLSKLADYLESNVKDEQFNMTYFRMDKIDPKSGVIHDVQYTSSSDCGTIGCALGYGPFVVEPSLCDYDDGTLSFIKYSDRNFINAKNELWNYLFSEQWEKLSPSRLSAVSRIRNVVNTKGEITGDICDALLDLHVAEFDI